MISMTYLHGSLIYVFVLALVSLAFAEFLPSAGLPSWPVQGASFARESPEKF